MAAKKENDTAEALTGALTELEKVELEAQARKEVMEALKESEKERFLEAAKSRIQAETLFRTAKDAKGEDLVTVQLELASHPKFIMLDGAVYHSGRKHTVTRSVAAVLLDQMHRGWEQELARIDPEQRDNLQRQRHYRLSSHGLRQVA